MADPQNDTAQTPQAAPPQEAQEIEMARHRGPRSEEEIALNAKEFLQRVNGSQDVTKGPFVDNVNPASVQYLLDRNELAKIDRNSLDPKTATDPAFNAKDKDGKDLPVYVVPSQGLSKNSAIIVTMENGQQIILANEGAHRWDNQYTRDHVMPSETEVVQLKKDGTLEAPDQFHAELQAKAATPKKLAEMEHRYQEIVEAINNDARKMGEKPPRILIDNDSGISMGAAAARVTKEGNDYIIIDKDMLMHALESNKNTETFISVIPGHEDAHMRLGGDISPERIVEAKSDLSIARFAEASSDLIGAGPLGSNDPKKAAKGFEQMLRDEYPEYMAEIHPGQKVGKPTKADLKKISDWKAKTDLLHPALLDRIEALNDEAKRKKEYEADFKKANGYAVTTDAERATESKAVVERVMKDMEGKWQRPVTPYAVSDEKSAAEDGSLSPAAQAQVGAIREMLIQMSQPPMEHKQGEPVAALPAVAAGQSQSTNVRGG